MSQKAENKKATEHIKEVLLTMDMEGDADHDAVLFLTTVRKVRSESENEKTGDIEIGSHIQGCKCSILYALIGSMKESPEFAKTVILASQHYLENHTVVGELVKHVSRQIKIHADAEKKQSDASKN